MKFAQAACRQPRTENCRGKIVRTSWLLAVLAFGVLTTGYLTTGSLLARAQTPEDEKAAADSPQKPAAKPLELLQKPVELKSLPRNLFVDQKNFWTTPFHMTTAEWQWTVPLAFIGAGMLASDTAIEEHVPTNPTTVSHAVTASNAGLAAMAGVGAGMFLWGHLTNNDQERETGLLSGEAGIDAFLDTEILKYAFGRDRPFTGDGRGRFFQGGDFISVASTRPSVGRSQA